MVYVRLPRSQDLVLHPYRKAIYSVFPLRYYTQLHEHRGFRSFGVSSVQAEARASSTFSRVKHSLLWHVAQRATATSILQDRVRRVWRQKDKLVPCCPGAPPLFAVAP